MVARKTVMNAKRSYTPKGEPMLRTQIGCKNAKATSVNSRYTSIRHAIISIIWSSLTGN